MKRSTGAPKPLSGHFSRSQAWDLNAVCPLECIELRLKTMIGRRRRQHVSYLSALVFAGLAPQANSFETSYFLPSVIFLQAGFRDDTTQNYVFAARWDWSWHRTPPFGEVTGFHEISFGRWSTDNGKSTTWATQLGPTPVVRVHPKLNGQSFGEIGIGANLIVPLYRSQEKRFSPIFNLGDHVAIARDFGEKNQHEDSLRFQHLSNAGIAKPNPGEDAFYLSLLAQLLTRRADELARLVGVPPVSRRPLLSKQEPARPSRVSEHKFFQAMSPSTLLPPPTSRTGEEIPRRVVPAASFVPYGAQRQIIRGDSQCIW